jgi:hypothetical protein
MTKLDIIKGFAGALIAVPIIYIVLVLVLAMG